ncbi:MAG TPA: hypothetical protein VJ725_34430 [Thermoanaerobaculia bacterium]|nr:hypothetical protein [Thermoanaerobaculia bacterium]
MEPVPQVAAHLSPAARRFLEYVLEDPERTRRLDHLAAGEFFAALQSWPTFVGGEKLAEIRRATVELTRLVKSIPERLFGNDARRIAAWYGFRNEALIAILLEPPSGLDGVLVRNDFIDTADGFKCLEVNAGHIGGWQLRFFEQRVRTHPVIARFLAQEGVCAYHRDPVETMLRSIIAHDAGKPATADGALNVAIGMNARPPGDLEAQVRRVYGHALEASGTGLTGEVAVCPYTDLSARQNRIWYRDRWPVHALVLMNAEAPAPEAVFRSFKAGRLSLYNGPINMLLNDKRILALLSEHAESALFTAEEQELLQRHLPWTRAVGPGAATWRGATAPLPELLLAHREELVLKPSRGSQGEGVTFGHLTPPDAWARSVAAAVAQGGWLAQERVASRPYVYQHGDRGYGMHDVVWGTFCFGASYGGGFLRMVPRGTGDGVINAARGAAEGVLFEV